MEQPAASARTLRWCRSPMIGLWRPGRAWRGRPPGRDVADRRSALSFQAMSAWWRWFARSARIRLGETHPADALAGRTRRSTAAGGATCGWSSSTWRRVAPGRGRGALKLGTVRSLQFNESGSAMRARPRARDSLATIRYNCCKRIARSGLVWVKLS